MVVWQALPPARGRLAAVLVVFFAAILWALLVGRLAVARQDNLQTNAFDLGYVSQAVWEDAHGEPFRFTTVQGVSAQLEGVDPAGIKHPHWLLAFHVEPALLLLAPLYRVWADPRLLLWLQAGIVALGAVPAALLAGRLLGSSAAAVVFGFSYLLAPGLEGAALSDFHMVAIGAALLMAALWLLETGRYRWALAAFGLAALCREDAAVAVAGVGAVVLAGEVFRQQPHRDAASAAAPSRQAATAVNDGGRATLSRARLWKRLGSVAAVKMASHADGMVSQLASPTAMGERQNGSRVTPRKPLWLDRFWPHGRRHQVAVALLAGGGLWALLCVGLIEPFFSGGASAFLGRYNWLLHAARHGDIGAVAAWFGTPDIGRYLAAELLTGGVVALLAPLQMLAALPLLAVNALSSFDWMRSGGGHYSALLVPLLLWAGMYGVRRLGKLSGAGLGIVLASALGVQAWIGVSPLALPAPDPRAQAALSALAIIPQDAPVSATSALYPHLSTRRQAYWFPAAGDAEWFALDLAGVTHPLSPQAARDAAIRLLGRPGSELVRADDGVLVVRTHSRAPREALLSDNPAQRTLGQVLAHDPRALPDTFYRFARVGGKLPTMAIPLSASFGGQLELAGYELRRWPEVGLIGGSATLVTYWRAAQPIGRDLRFALATTRSSDGALSGFREDAAAAPLWYPTTSWQSGEIVRLEMPIDQLRHVRALGVAVLDGQRRLAVSGAPAEWDGQTIAQVVRLR